MKNFLFLYKPILILSLISLNKLMILYNEVVLKLEVEMLSADST